MPNSSSREAQVTATTARAYGGGKELPGLAFQVQPFAQAAPFGAVGVVDEHGQDARSLSRAGATAAVRRRTPTATSSSRPARATSTHTPPPALVTARCA